MDVTPLIRRDAKIIQSYKNGVFKISGETYTGPIVLCADRVAPWPIHSLTQLEYTDFALMADWGIEVVLLGTGDKQIFLSADLRRAVKGAYGITIETMDNGAASRTYNVLMAEGRQVAAALTP